MKMRKVVLFLVVLLECCFAFAETYEMRYPDGKKARDDRLAAVRIETNIQGASVYIEGKLVGKTNLFLDDLNGAYYNIEIRKDGYDTIRCRIEAKRRYTYTYRFTLVKTCGYVTVKNKPSNATVYIDGISVSYFPHEVTPGSHTVKIRKFGYDDFEKTVVVPNHRTVDVDPVLRVSPFEIRNFRVSKGTINPDHKGGIGKTTISFYVTNNGYADITAKDRYGNVVWEYSFDSFSTWEHSVSWDGRGYYGESLPDGEYTVELSSGSYHFEKPVKISRAYSYPLISYTPSGSGFGTSAYAFASEANFVKPFVDFGVMLYPNSEKGSSIYSLPLDFGMIINFAKSFEMAGSVGFAYKSCFETLPVSFNFSLKGTGVAEIDSEKSLCYAGFVRYGHNNVYEYAPEGVDFGNGLGFGASVGIDSKSFYAGVSAEYVLAATIDKSTLKKDSVVSGNILNYGAAVSVYPAKSVRLNGWGTVHNMDTFEVGAGIVAMPASGSLCVDGKVMAFIKKNNNNPLLTGQIGLSYLF